MTPVLRLWSLWILAILLCLAGAQTPLNAAAAESADASSEEARDQINPATGKPFIPNKRCLKCHGDEEDQTVERDDGTVVNIYVHPEDLAAKLHGEQYCQSCHANVTDTKHEDDPPQILVSCVECHQQTWEQHKEDTDPRYQRLGVVVQQIDSYMHSVHARPSRVDQSRPMPPATTATTPTASAPSAARRGPIIGCATRRCADAATRSRRSSIWTPPTAAR